MWYHVKMIECDFGIILMSLLSMLTWDGDRGVIQIPPIGEPLTVVQPGVHLLTLSIRAGNISVSLLGDLQP